MKTIKDVFVQYQQGLRSIYDQHEIEAITLLVLNNLLNLSNANLKAFPETEIAFHHIQQLEYISSELKIGRPVQYILGHTEFYGLPFKVNQSVLIPRQETEELVQWIIEVCKKSSVSAINILDIGTGSGCIAITLKKHLYQSQVFAMDISTDALAVANNNAKLIGVDINFIEADILNFNFSGHIPNFDIIVSNPPYVSLSDKLKMHHNVINFEPHNALFVPEENPLLFYIAIADFALKHLTKNGLLFLEINENYGNHTVKMLTSKGFKNIELRQDMSGKDRMVKAELQQATFTKKYL